MDNGLVTFFSNIFVKTVKNENEKCKYKKSNRHFSQIDYLILSLLRTLIDAHQQKQQNYIEICNMKRKKISTSLLVQIIFNVCVRRSSLIMNIMK